MPVYPVEQLVLGTRGLGQFFNEEAEVEFDPVRGDRLDPDQRAGVSRTNRLFSMACRISMACRRISALVAGGVLASSQIVTVIPWILEGELVLTILALAMVLLGTIAKSRFAVRMCVARQFISMIRPSVPPSILIQSPGR